MSRTVRTPSSIRTRALPAPCGAGWRAPLRRFATHPRRRLFPWLPLRPPHLLTLLLLGGGLLNGCRPAPPAAPPGVSVSAERGPVEFRITAAPPEPWVGDPITLELYARTPSGYEVVFPQAAQYGELELRSLGRVQTQPHPDGGLIWRQQVILEAFASGPLELPPLVLTYQPPQPSPPSATQPVAPAELASDTLTLTVRSVLTTQDTVTQPRDITATLLPPPAPWPWWSYLLMIAAPVAAGLLLVFAARSVRRWAERPTPPLAPEVWALRALAELERSDWHRSSRIRDFYYRLTGIMRDYIERQFGLAAPEMTTDEFLVTLLREPQRLPCDAGRLRDFLEACDYVKYAAYEPQPADAEAALGAARSFVSATAAAARPAQMTEQAA